MLSTSLNVYVILVYVDVVYVTNSTWNQHILQGDQVVKPGFFGHYGIDPKMVLNFTLVPY